MPGAVFAQSAPGSEIARTAKLRTGMILIGALGGVGEPVGKFIAAKLGIPYEPVVPARAAEAATRPYLLPIMPR